MNARITFRNVPLHKLANFSFKDVTAACKSFIENADASECLIIQTSSRIEVFTVGGIQTGEIPDARRNFETDGTPAKVQGKKLPKNPAKKKQVYPQCRGTGGALTVGLQ